jgi:hypothetical protein
MAPYVFKISKGERHLAKQKLQSYGGSVTSPLQYAIGEKQFSHPAHTQERGITRGCEYQE